MSLLFDALKRVQGDEIKTDASGHDAHSAATQSAQALGG